MILTHRKWDCPSWSYRGLNTSLAIHFNVSIAFPLLVLENLKKYDKGDYAGKCAIIFGMLCSCNK